MWWEVLTLLAVVYLALSISHGGFCPVCGRPRAWLRPALCRYCRKGAP